MESAKVSRGAIWELSSHYGKNSTFTFVRFTSSNDMESAIEKMNNTRIDGRIISVSKAKFSAPSKKLVIPSISKTGGEVELGVEQGGCNAHNPSKLVPKVFEASKVDDRSFKYVLMGNHNFGMLHIPLGDRRPSNKEKEGENSLLT
ncbi:hypothetical protein GQ457_08G032380 [Hibiscus cannabinus]